MNPRPPPPPLPPLSALPGDLRRDASRSALVAGFVAVLVGFTSSVAIVFQAATALGATPAQLSSWMWALGVGMGLTSLLPSLLLRQPVLTAWSTPGAAVVATAAAAGGISMAQAVGAFIVCGLLIVVSGASGLFERVMNRIPLPLAQGLLAGVLARFALDATGAVKTAPLLVLGMLAAYLLGRRLWPRYAVPGVLLAGVGLALLDGRLAPTAVGGALAGGWASPVFTFPEFDLGVLVSLALPLFIVTMASQNLPGVAAIRSSGFSVPISPVVTLTGAATVLLAPFGGYALNLAAITAAICMGREAHEDPARRWVATVSAGVLYLLVGLFGAAVAGLMVAFPRELVAAIAALALLGTIGAALAGALAADTHREAALLTFIVTLSGVSVAGIGSAFWGVVVGAVALAVQQWRKSG